MDNLVTKYNIILKRVIYNLAMKGEVLGKVNLNYFSHHNFLELLLNHAVKNLLNIFCKKSVHYF